MKHLSPTDARRDTIRVKAKLFRGLADRSRLSLLEALRDGPQNVSTLVERTGLSQPNTSMHLNCLWCCGLVDKEVRGRFSYYSVKSDRVLGILEAAERVLDEVYDRIAECARYEEAPDVSS
jgi:DNA-binding transcriptional ArsR family regulator